jgi:hypothetical protein
MRVVVLVAVTALAAAATGCGDSPPRPREACSLCRGTGRSSGGPACTFCVGRGYRELSQYEVDRRRQAEANLRARESGTALGAGRSWWDSMWERVKWVAGLVVAAILYSVFGQPRGTGRGTAGPSKSDP